MSDSCWKCGALPCRPDMPPAPSSVDVARLLMTNDAPRGSDIPSVLNVITETRGRLGLLDAQIESVRATLAKLSRARDEMAESLRQHQAILSPVRRIPLELLCEIFRLTLLWKKRVDGVDLDQPPWHLGHVCAPWRNAAIGDPALWRVLQVLTSGEVAVTDNCPLSMLETTLLRSANLSLDVTFGGWSANRLDPAWLDSFVAHCSRWAYLHIFHPPDSVGSRQILRRITGRLLALQKLDVFGAPLAPASKLADYFSVAPALREVLLTDPYFDERSHTLPIPWGQITHYRAHYSPAQHFDILQSAPNLVQCGLGFRIDETDLDADKVVSLPHLCRLESRDFSFLNHLRLPSLRTLFLNRDAVTLPPLIRRSSCPLTQLVLREYAKPSELPMVLRSAPSLTSLVLEVGRRLGEQTKDFFQAMTVSGTPSDLCPNLSSFVFSRSDGRFYREATLFSMVRSRLTPNLCCRRSFLRIFTLYDDYDSDRDMPPRLLLAQIQELANEGLDAAFLFGGVEAEELMRMRWSDSS
ncbi:hypothetical protein FB451DRAFT_1270906 [Mycena latifolia]|nr:hypothetical protein FB451DRAFT_1270906 [Mycena latifolia]